MNPSDEARAQGWGVRPSNINYLLTGDDAMRPGLFGHSGVRTLTQLGIGSRSAILLDHPLTNTVFRILPHITLTLGSVSLSWRSLVIGALYGHSVFGHSR